jgi:hypothetical protein
MDPIDSYKEEIASRFLALPEEEKQILKTLPDSPFASPLSKLLGPEMSEVFNDMYPREVVEETPQPQPEAPVGQQMRRAGLGSR